MPRSGITGVRLAANVSPRFARRAETPSRSDVSMVAAGFNPPSTMHTKPHRRVATIDSSDVPPVLRRRYATQWIGRHSRPRDKSHGYYRDVATRQTADREAVIQHRVLRKNGNARCTA
jgi:hypothetical protein